MGLGDWLAEAGRLPCKFMGNKPHRDSFSCPDFYGEIAYVDLETREEDWVAIQISDSLLLAGKW
jgi:hypothetical protein